ncbi:PREDICTED: defensin-like protein 24 [Camelina sativa]|uniref:Defensin-like protein 24 n=1 Tax=Camelina sativa TaxID=90675 RepID=A0ABM1QTE8_CAMSA|nr:PREDICTED: defensin-like protein 24 [Camelina sativa]
MAYSKIVIFAILALPLLLSGAETRKAVLPGSELFKMCCKNQPEFGTCDTKEDDERCTQMCLDGCSTNKGGGCQPISAAPGSVCSCYC